MRRLLIVAALTAGAGLAQAQAPGAVRTARERATSAVNATNAQTRTAEAAGQEPAQPAAARRTPRNNATPAATAAANGAAAQDSGEVSRRGTMGQLTFRRETYAYEAAGRRDPFVSLMSSGDLRPVITELRIATILHDASGRNSVAILRDTETKEQFRVRVGQTLGRMRVTRIEPRRVTFTIDEFGFSRQETLTLGDTTNARTP